MEFNRVLAAEEALTRAARYSWETQKADGHWNGELRANVTLSAEQVFFHQSLPIVEGKRRIPQSEAYQKYLIKEQQIDGSWAIAPEHPGDVSTSVEAYLALRILGTSPDCPEMTKARHFILQCGGVAKVRVFTRIFLAQFGLFPWAATPEMPTELILLPACLPINVYRLASWARSTVIPLLLIVHHRPVYELPNGISRNNDFIDELWLDPTSKMVPLGPSLLNPLASDWLSYMFMAIDGGLRYVNGLRQVPFMRSYARKKCVEWILERQEKEGDWAGIIPPMHAGVQALLLEGVPLDSPVIQKALEAIERFTWEDHNGKRLQSCVSPVWDTVLMIRGLCDGGVERQDKRLLDAVHWLRQRQQMGPEGDWRVFKPNLIAGGFSFEYNNTWYPDVDDTAAAILALVRQDPGSIDSHAVVAAVMWLCGMQNKDGGWGAFDIDNDRIWLNSIPFSDMDSLCDPSSADCTGRILEAFGLIMQIERENCKHDKTHILDAMQLACSRAIQYLAHEQEPTGAWYGRWGVNYIYGTSNVLCGLAYFDENKSDESLHGMTNAAISWLKYVQNDDGGWGESVLSYADPRRHAGRGASTPSQTAWAIMGLLTICGPEDPIVVAGIDYLLRTQVDFGPDHSTSSWEETLYTGTGFPNFFYIGYTLYRHYFPLMALGRFLSRSRGVGKQPLTDI